jgi:hypothetical protein
VKKTRGQKETPLQKGVKKQRGRHRRRTLPRHGFLMKTKEKCINNAAEEEGTVIRCRKTGTMEHIKWTTAPSTAANKHSTQHNDELITYVDHVLLQSDQDVLIGIWLHVLIPELVRCNLLKQNCMLLISLL